MGEQDCLNLEKENKKSKRRLKDWEIAFLIMGSPLWISFAIVAISVIFSIYAAVWSVIAAFWATFGALVGGFVGGIASGIIFICVNKLLVGLVMIGAGLVCGGFAVFAFVGCLYATKGAARLSKKAFMGIINIFREKESV